MLKHRMWIGVFALFVVACMTLPVAADVEGDLKMLMEQDTLTGNWFGLGDDMAEYGVQFNVGMSVIYQHNVRGGVRRGRGAGDESGSIDYSLDVDLGKLVGIDGGRIFVSAQSSWSDGIEAYVGIPSYVNDDADGDDAIFVQQVYYEQRLFDDMLIVRLGRISLSSSIECRGCLLSFDANAYANDENAQFLNGAFVNNPAIPFPEHGLGAVVVVQPVDWLYVSAGVSDAEADERTPAVRSAFKDSDYFFYIFEAGVIPEFASSNGLLRGTYRVGVWYDPQPKAYINVLKGNKRDDAGFYTSFDQMISRENNDPEDAQGLGVFGRFSIQPSDVNDLKLVYMGGFQYQGLIPTRDNDVLGVAFGYGVVSQGRRDQGFNSNASILEAYYNFEVAPWFHLSPDVQVFHNPGGNRASKDAVAVGGRARIDF